MSLEKLKEALADFVRDEFEVGTVIRWETDAGRAVYVYAAVKAPGLGWFTTARAGNGFVPQVVSYEDLVEILGRSETTKVEVASSWESVR